MKKEIYRIYRIMIFIDFLYFCSLFWEIYIYINKYINKYMNKYWFQFVIDFLISIFLLRIKKHKILSMEKYYFFFSDFIIRLY